MGGKDLCAGARTETSSYFVAPGCPRSEEETESEIIRCAAEQFGVTEKQVLGNRREKNILFARKVAMYLIRTEVVAFDTHAPISYPAIGKIFNKDHSTVLHACQTMTHLLTYNDEIITAVQAIKRSVGLTTKK